MASKPMVYPDRPHSTPPRPIRSSISSVTSRPRIRAPLESARSVLSVELFQRRHAQEFAHLHSDADDRMLAAERSRLEMERRLGREKRQSRMKENLIPKRAMSVDGKAPSWRPLSLIENRDTGRSDRRSNSVFGVLTPKRTSTQQPTVTPPAQVFSLPPISIAESLSADFPPLTTPLATSQGLEVLVERDSPAQQTTSSPHTKSSPGSKSLAQSTYSWATSFSGETAELRNAAHYVPSEPDADHTDPTIDHTRPTPVLDSPAKREQRRKRIVAIAHTVRQLEGVGSRELEDPTLYNELAETWYARSGNRQPPPTLGGDLQRPPNLPLTPGLQNPISYVPPFVPDSERSAAALRRFRGLAINDMVSSPPDPEFQTPHQEYGAAFASASHYAYPTRTSIVPSDESNSVRYSYASTLHDLAMDGGAQHGAKLMSEKAWLRPRSFVGTPWGGEFAAPPSRRRPTTPANSTEYSLQTPEVAAAHQGLDSPLQLMPGRGLRRVEGSVGRSTGNHLSSHQGVSREHPATHATPRHTPMQNEAGSSRWGLGFVSSWWDATTSTAQIVTPQSTMQAQIPVGNTGAKPRPPIPDFHLGEDIMIPSRSQVVPRRTSSNRSSIVLDPNPIFTILHPDSNALNIPAPPPHQPRRLLFDDMTPTTFMAMTTATTPHDASNSPRGSMEMGTRWKNQSRTLRRVRSDPLGYQSLNPSPRNSTRTHSSTSSAPLQAHQVLTLDETLEEDLEGVGSIGSETSLPPLMSRVPLDLNRPPLQNPPLVIPSDQLPPRRYLQIQTFGPQETIPTFSVAVKPTMLEASLPIPPLSIPIRTSSRPPNFVNSSYHNWLHGTAWSPPRLLEDLPPTPMTQHGQLRSVSSKPQLPPLAHLSPRPRLEVDIQLPMPVASTFVPPMEGPRVNQWTRPRILFIVGFILPFLWLIGGWWGSRLSKHDLERGIDQQVGREKSQSASSPWWRWYRHPDPWVESCRIAVAVMVPTILLAVVLMASLLSVL